MAAQHGHAAAQVNLGYCYYHGYGVPQNTKHARELFQLALNQGHPGADSLVKQLEDEETGGGSGKAAGTKKSPPPSPARGRTVDTTPGKSTEDAPPSPTPKGSRYSATTGEAAPGSRAWGEENTGEKAQEDGGEEAVELACCFSPKAK